MFKSILFWKNTIKTRVRQELFLSLGEFGLDSREDGLLSLFDLVLLGGQRLLGQVVRLDGAGRFLVLLLRRW